MLPPDMPQTPETAPGSDSSCSSGPETRSNQGSVDLHSSLVSARQNPPRFDNGHDYSYWRKKISMWKLVTGYAKSQQAMIVMLSCFEYNSRAESLLSDLPVTDLRQE